VAFLPRAAIPDKRGRNSFKGIAIVVRHGASSIEAHVAATDSATGAVWTYSWHAVIRVYDDAGNVIETHEAAGEFKEP
jgi:hypothetical protein